MSADDNDRFAELEQERDAWHALANFRTTQRDKERVKKERLWDRLAAVRVDLATVMDAVITKTGSPVYDNAVERLQYEAASGLPGAPKEPA